MLCGSLLCLGACWRKDSTSPMTSPLGICRPTASRSPPSTGMRQQTCGRSHCHLQDSTGRPGWHEPPAVRPPQIVPRLDAPARALVGSRLPAGPMLPGPCTAPGQIIAAPCAATSCGPAAAPRAGRAASRPAPEPPAPPLCRSTPARCTARVSHSSPGWSLQTSVHCPATDTCKGLVHVTCLGC